MKQYLTFLLGDEEYAVEILRVREIIEYVAPTRVPSVPACIAGVVNLRGTVVPVIDLGIKFGFGQVHVTRRTCIVMIEVAIDGTSTLMGLVVDAVSRVIELLPENIESPPPFGTRVRVDFLLGLATVEGRFALLLDVDRVLTQHELLAAIEIAAPADPAGP